MVELCLNEVEFTYPATRNCIFQSIQWKRINPGTVGILGTNGSGKSTLLKLISGILLPTNGQILIDKRSVKSIKIARSMVAFVPENARLFLVGPTPRKDLMRILKDEKATQDALEAFGFAQIADKKLYHLSEGQRRLFALIAAFHLPRKVYLFDEPTIGLDSKGRELFFRSLRKAKSENKIVLVSTNDARVFPYLDEIVVIKDGIIAINGPPKDALYELEQQTNLIPNQTVRLIQGIENKLNYSLPRCLTVEEVNAIIDKGGG